MTTETPDLSNVVTNENFGAYVDARLGKSEAAEPEPDTPEALAAEQLAELEGEGKVKNDLSTPAPKEGDVDGSKVYFQGRWVGKNDFNYRLHLKALDIAAEKQKDVDAAKEDAKKAREEAKEAARRAEELQAKYDPPKTDELGPEPQPEQFTDLGEYKKAIKEWTADATRRDDAVKQQKAAAEAESRKVVEEWGKRLTAFKAETPDYDSTLEAAKDLRISDPVRDAVIESDVGPQILYHLAQNPDLVESIGKLKVGPALKAIGRLEERFSKPAEKPSTSLAEISQAPAPITPIRNASAPVVRLSGHTEVPKNLSFEDWKRLRKAGKIQ